MSLQNLGLAFLGCLVGTLVGVLPGVGPIATIAMLLPITFGLDPTGALIMLAGIYYGAQYGGSTTAILVNIPARPPPWSPLSTVTRWPARAGRRGARHRGHRLLLRRHGGDPGHRSLGKPLTGLALLFGPTEYFSLMIMGLVFAVVLAHGSILKAVAMILVGVLLSTVGTDLETGEERMTFGLPFLADGIDFAVLAMGIFGIAEILRNLDHTETRDVVRQAIGRLLPNKDDFRQAYKPVHAARIGRSSASCRAMARCSGRSPPIRGRSSPRIRAASAAAPSRAWPGRRSPTMPARRPRSSRC